MKIIKNAYASVYSPDKDVLRKVKHDLTMDNPAFAANDRMGISNFATRRTLKYFDNSGDVLKVPIGYWQEHFHYLPSEDRRTEGYSEEIPKLNFKATLGAYQEEAVSKLQKFTNGVLSAPTGSGKTVMALALIHRLRRNTIFVVDTIDLANQFKSRCSQFLGYEPGLIGSGKFETTDIAVAILQTLTKLDEDQFKILNAKYGCVIVDEVHILPANSFFYAVTKLSAKYKYGLSATVHGRSDGLTNVIFWATGPERFSIKLEQAAKNLCIPEFEYVESEFEFPIFNVREYNTLLEYLSKDEERNKLIVDIREKYKDKNAIITVNRTEHAELLSTMIPGARYVTGSMNKKIRMEAIEGFLSGKYTTLIGTFKLLAKGLDSKKIEVAIVASPTNSEIDTKQLIGRTMRSDTDKKALIIDIVDSKVSMLKTMHANRKRWYKKYIELGKK